MKSAGASSRRSTATADARPTRCIGSATSCAPARNTSPTARRPAWRRRSPPTTGTSRSRSPGSAPNTCDPSTTSPTTPTADASPRRSWPRSHRVRSRRSPDSAAPSAMARRVPRLLHHGRRQQRWYREHQRVDRTRPTRRPRVPRPRQLPPPDAPHRRRSTTMTPRSSQKSPFMDGRHVMSLKSSCRSRA